MFDERQITAFFLNQRIPVVVIYIHDGTGIRFGILCELVTANAYNITYIGRF